MKVICIRYPKNYITDFLICAFCVLLIILIFQNSENEIVNSNTYETDIVIDFFDKYDLIVDLSSSTVSYVVFNKNELYYSDYRDFQMSQGFDIAPFIGKRVMKISYELLNYRGAETTDGYYVNVYLYNSEIIAAEIICVSLDGFMEGVISER